MLCEAALHPPRRPVPSNPNVHNVHTIQVTSSDGVALRAWFFTPLKPNGSVVLLLHGIADSRASQLGLARMFLNHGYAVLAPDSRAHGKAVAIWRPMVCSKRMTCIAGLRG